MQSFIELTPPSAVSHAVGLPFIAPKANNLVIAKTSLLQIFDTKNVTTEADPSPQDGNLLSHQEAIAGVNDAAFMDSEFGGS